MADASVWLLLCWELQLGVYSVFFFFPPGYVALWDSKTRHRPAGEKVSWCLEISPPSQLPPWDRFPSLTLLSLFFSLIFCLNPFEESGLLCWVLGVFCQCSEVVLWKLLSVQIIFWWICWGESGLLLLFLCCLRTTLKYLLISCLQSPSAVILEPPQNKICHCFPIYLSWSHGTRWHDLSFLNGVL